MKEISGKKISEKILRDLKEKIRREKQKPTLAVVLVGQDRPSKIYVNLKKKAARRIGMGFKLVKYHSNVSEKKIIEEIRRFNEDKKINGIIVQLPLPSRMNTQKIINSIDYKKDVDGFHPKSLEIFKKVDKDFPASPAGGWPVLPQAVLQLIKESNKSIKGKKALVISHSSKFGEVMERALQKKGAKARYILSSSLSKNRRKLKRADILVTAVGKPKIIKGNDIREGAILIDGGITKKGRRVLGDIDAESVENMSGSITPVPGGVGPVTIACLLNNVYLAFKHQK